MTVVKDFYVYEHREGDTGRVFYVGKGRGNRLHSSSGRNKKWQNVRASQGFTAHKIYEGLSEIDAFRLEVEITTAYGVENLTNTLIGGGGVVGHRWTDEGRMMLSIASKSNATKMQRFRAFALSDQNPSKKQENRKASSERMSRHNPSHDSIIVSRSVAKRRGRKLTKEQREKHKMAMPRGDQHRLFGKQPSAHMLYVLAQCREKRKRAVITECGLWFESTLAASKATGARQGAIVNACTGRCKSAGGYKWLYDESRRLTLCRWLLIP